MASMQTKQIVKTLIAAAVVAFVCSMPMMGLFVYVIIFLEIFPYLPYQIWAYFKKPEQRKLNAIKSVIWVLVPVIIIVSHFVQYKINRSRADAIVASINQFMQTNHRCPKNLEEIGLSDEILRERLLMGMYSCGKNDDHPFFSYSVGFAPFATYDYDFEKQGWGVSD